MGECGRFEEKEAGQSVRRDFVSGVAWWLTVIEPTTRLTMGFYACFKTSKRHRHHESCLPVFSQLFLSALWFHDVHALDLQDFTHRKVL